MMNKAEQSKAFFDNTDGYLKSNVVVSLRKKIIKEMLGPLSGKKVIDIGCGNGELTSGFIRENRITFLDISANMLALVEKSIPAGDRKNASFVNCDLLAFTTGETFDVVVCIGVLAHVPDVAASIKKLNSLLAEGGRLVVQYTASEKFISGFNHVKNKLLKKNKYNYNVNRTSSPQIIKLLEEQGLTVVTQKKYIPVSPFLSPFGKKTKLKLLELSTRKNLMNRMGSEVILLLEKK